MRKGEIACNKLSLIFHNVFYAIMANMGLIFNFKFKMSSAICFNLDQSKILLSGNGLRKLKAFADDESNIAKMIISILYKVKNIVEKEENEDFQLFFLFQ